MAQPPAKALRSCHAGFRVLRALLLQRHQRLRRHRQQSATHAAPLLAQAVRRRVILLELASDESIHPTKRKSVRRRERPRAEAEVDNRHADFADGSRASHLDAAHESCAGRLAAHRDRTGRARLPVAHCASVEGVHLLVALEAGGHRREARDTACFPVTCIAALRPARRPARALL